MPTYYVAKTPKGEFVGQFELDSIPGLIKRGNIQPHDFATEAIGSYEAVIKHGTAKWITVAALLGDPYLAGSTHGPEGAAGASGDGCAFVSGVLSGMVIVFLGGILALAVFGPGALFVYPIGCILAGFVLLSKPGFSRGTAIGLFLGAGGWLLLLSICGGLWR